MHKGLLRCGALLLLAALFLALSACGERTVIVGRYTCLAADSGEVYIFTEKEMRITLYVMGQVYVDLYGTYTIKGEEITFHLPDDDDGFYAGVHSFRVLDDETIEIDGNKYVRE